MDPKLKLDTKVLIISYNHPGHTGRIHVIHEYHPVFAYIVRCDPPATDWRFASYCEDEMVPIPENASKDQIDAVRRIYNVPEVL